MDPSWGWTDRFFFVTFLNAKNPGDFVTATLKARNLIDASFCPLTFSSSLKVGVFVVFSG